jgi:hypothetical protein
MLGVHATVVNDYGSYRSVRLSKRGKARIWFEDGELPVETAINVVCARCGKTYFIKYIKPDRHK